MAEAVIVEVLEAEAEVGGIELEPGDSPHSAHSRPSFGQRYRHFAFLTQFMLYHHQILYDMSFIS